MNYLLFVSALLLSVSSAASAVPAPAKTGPSAAHPDLLSSVRSHAAALNRQPLASRSVTLRGALTVPPAFASPQATHLGTVIAAASMNGRR